jgi:hypothetical protein
MAIQSTSLTLATSNIYVSSGSTVVSVMYFCNQGSSAANLNVWATSAGSTFGAANLVYREIQLAAADTYVVDMEKLVLGSGDYIRANAGGTVSATVSYVGI